MLIYVITEKDAALKAFFPKNTVFMAEANSKPKLDDVDFIYIDVADFSDAKINKTLIQLKKSFKGSGWGIIDTKGILKDPASLFFDGASDYLGPDFFINPHKKINPKRIKAAFEWRETGFAGGQVKEKEEIVSSPSVELPRTGIKPPPMTLFPGWKKMRTGKTMPFYLLYCAIHGKTALNTRLGEKAYDHLRQRLLAYLFQSFREGDGLAWIHSGNDFLFLLPPKVKNAEAATKACVKMLASAPLVAIEALGLPVPVNFVFALHYGSIRYSPPGETGTVVSDAVNFAFHLGGKKAEPGSFTISDELPDGSIPQALEDCFVPFGEFEGRKIWHTKKFGYSKPWW